MPGIGGAGLHEHTGLHEHAGLHEHVCMSVLWVFSLCMEILDVYFDCTCFLVLVSSIVLVCLFGGTSHAVRGVCQDCAYLD